MDREWELQAACRSYNPEIWFSDARTAAAEAKAVCRECPVRDECLEAILARESRTPDTHRWGIAAGLTGLERARLAAERRVGTVEPRRQYGPGRPLAPCGTRSAYERHLRRGEPVDLACREAHAEASKEYRQKKASTRSSGSSG